VRAALRAASERLVLLRFLAAVVACLESAAAEAPALPSFFNAREIALDRLTEGLLVARELVFLDAPLAFAGGGIFIPAFRAFDNPMAIACLAFRTPCFPSLTWSISSRTNSPAWVEGDLPSRASSRARIKVSFSGITSSRQKGHSEISIC